MVGQHVDLEHKCARVFCAEYNYREPDVGQIRKDAAKANAPTYDAPPNVTIPPDESEGDLENAEAYLNMPLREIVYRYGTQKQFKEFTTAAKHLIQMQGFEEEQARRRGEYIHRSHAERLVAMIDGMQKALLTDAVTNIATTVEAQVKSGTPKKEIEKSMRNTISRVIKTAKAQLVRSLRDV